MVEEHASNRGYPVNRARRMVLVCLLVVLNTSADMIVDLGAARDFMFLDIGTDPLGSGQLSGGVYEGNMGWSGGMGTQLEFKNVTFNADIYRTEDSLLRLKGKSELLGTDYSGADMTGFISAVDAAVARFGTFARDMDLGVVNQTGGLTINRTDAYTVVDVSEMKLTSGTLTINGETIDLRPNEDSPEEKFFDIRIKDVFELSNVDVVVNGTDASRVFFIFEGSGDLEFKGGELYGNIIAPNASVSLTHLDAFDGSMISGGGFTVTGANKESVIRHTEAIPESTVLGLVATVGGAAIFIHRFFKFRRVNVRTEQDVQNSEAVDSAG